LLPPGQHPEQLYKALSEILNEEDVLVVYGNKIQDARFKMQDAGWDGKVFDLQEIFPDFNLSEVAEMILNDNSLNKLKFKKEILVAEAYTNMVDNEPEDHILEVITYFGNTSVKIIQNLFSNLK